jgi:hypothetical protein
MNRTFLLCLPSSQNPLGKIKSSEGTSLPRLLHPILMLHLQIFWHSYDMRATGGPQDLV